MSRNRIFVVKEPSWTKIKKMWKAQKEERGRKIAAREHR
jgi:hypothetical protein